MKAVLRGLLLLVALLVVLALLGLTAHAAITSLFSGVDPTVAAAIVAGVATTLVSVLGLVLARYYERKQRIEFEIRERKIPMYTQMVEGLLGILDMEKPEAQRGQEMLALFKTLTPQLVTWASDDVLVTWSRYKRGAGTADSVAYLFQFEKVLMAIRKDFGHANLGVARGDLLGLFVTDIDEHLKL